jgi:hypothetical protein
VLALPAAQLPQLATKPAPLKAAIYVLVNSNRLSQLVLMLMQVLRIRC